MRRAVGLRRWCREFLAKSRARRLRQPVYPFAGTVTVLRRTARRLRDDAAVKAYCEGLPANVFCHVDDQCVGWWILSDHMLWMAKVDRKNLNVAFAACVGFHADHPEAIERMQETVQPLYARPGASAVAWEERLAALGGLSAAWMRRDKAGSCLPGLVVSGKVPSNVISPQEPMRTALRLQRPQRFDVAVPLILHGLWADLRQKNVSQTGEVADSWQLACALVDNPWESWQTVRSGRFAQVHTI